MEDDVVSTPENYARRRQVVAWILIPLIVVVGVLLAINATVRDDVARRVLFLSFFFFQASLIGIGGGFGLIGIVPRWLFVGILLVELHIVAGREVDREAVLAGVMPILSIGLVCRMLSVWRGLIPVRIDETQLRSQKLSLQFTVWNLLGATTVVACLISLARWGRRENEELVYIAIWCAFYMAIALMAVWTLLGLGRPLRRLAAFAAISVAIGVACDWFLGGRGMRLLIATTALEACMLIAFLSIVRWAGWRLVPSDCVVAVGEREAVLHHGWGGEVLETEMPNGTIE